MYKRIMTPARSIYFQYVSWDTTQEIQHTTNILIRKETRFLGSSCFSH